MVKILNPQNCKLTVCIPTFQHEKFIAQTIEGCLSQITNFDFKIIISDDGSTDQTAEFIKSYQIKYPQIIEAYLHSKNLGPENPRELKGKNNVKFLFSKINTDYIAICEGDDYWIDAFKLQRQVDFLNTNLDFNLYHHQSEIYYQNSNLVSSFNKKSRPSTNEVTEMLNDEWVIATNTAVFRNNFEKGLSSTFENAISGDWAIFFQAIQEKKIYYSPLKMGVYRKHTGGVTNILDNSNELYLKNRLQMFESLRGIYSKSNNTILENTIENHKKTYKFLGNT